MFFCGVTCDLHLVSQTAEMEAISRGLYNTFFRRNSTYFVYIVAGGFAAERVVNRGGDYIWEKLNEGVRFSFDNFL